MTAADMDARIAHEFATGTDVPTIAARYGVPEDYVDRVIEQTSYSPAKRRHDWGWSNWGNRIAYSVLTAIAVSLLTDSRAIGWTLGLILFAVTSAMVSIRGQAGWQRQP